MRIIFFLAIFSLSSCTVGPDYKADNKFSDKDIAQSLNLVSMDTQPTKDWYKGFNDSKLNELITKADSQNLDIKIAFSKLEQARNNLQIAKGAYLPTLDGKGLYSNNYPSKNMGFVIGTDYYETGLNASWEIDFWGKGRRATEAAKATEQLGLFNIENTQKIITADVAKNYVALKNAQENLKIAHKNLKLQLNIYQIVKDKYDAGLTDDLSLNQANYIVKTTSALIPTLESNIESLKNSLFVLTSELPSNWDLEASNLVSQKFDYDLNQLYALPIDVVRNRPDVKIAEQQLIAQNAQVGVAVANLYPNINLSGFIGYASINSGKLIEPNSNMYNYSPTLNLPIFHWGQLQNDVKLQKNIKEEYLLNYQSKVLSATADIKSAIKSIESEYKKNIELENARNHAKEIFILSKTKYQSGLIDFSDLLTAMQDYLNAQNNLINSNAEIYQNLINFYLNT